MGCCASELGFDTFAAGASAPAIETRDFLPGTPEELEFLQWYVAGLPPAERLPFLRLEDNRALRHASACGCIPALRYLCDQGLTHQDAAANRHEALTEACRRGDLATATALLELFGADLNDIRGTGYAPMRLACTNGHLAVAQRLQDVFGSPPGTNLVNQLTVGFNCARQILVEDRLAADTAARSMPLFRLLCARSHLAMIMWLAEQAPRAWITPNNTATAATATATAATATAAAAATSRAYFLRTACAGGGAEVCSTFGLAILRHAVDLGRLGIAQWATNRFSVGPATARRCQLLRLACQAACDEASQLLMVQWVYAQFAVTLKDLGDLRLTFRVHGDSSNGSVLLWLARQASLMCSPPPGRVAGEYPAEVSCAITSHSAPAPHSAPAGRASQHEMPCTLPYTLLPSSEEDSASAQEPCPRQDSGRADQPAAPFNGMAAPSSGPGYADHWPPTGAWQSYARA